MVNRKSGRLRAFPATSSADVSKYGSSTSGPNTGEVKTKTVRSSGKRQVSMKTDEEEEAGRERNSSSENAITESGQSVKKTENTYEEAHGLLLLAKLSEEERASNSFSRPKRNLKRPAKFNDTFVKIISPKKPKTADYGTTDDGKAKCDLSSLPKKSLKSPAKKGSDISGQDGDPGSKEKEAFCLRLNLQGKTERKQSKESKLKKDAQQMNKPKQKKDVKSASKSQRNKRNQKDDKATSEKLTKKAKQRDGQSVSLTRQANKMEQNSKKLKEYKKRIPKRKEVLVDSDDMKESEKSLPSKDESPDKKNLVHVFVDPKVLQSSKSAQTKPTAVSKSNSFTNACVVQFGGKAFILNTPPSVGELTPNKVLHQLLPFVKEKCRDGRDMVIKEINKSSTKDAASKDSSPQGQQSMSGIEAILKAVELISTDEKEASSSSSLQCENLGECFLTYPIHSPNNDISYRTVRMSSLDTLEISKTLSKFVEKEHDYTGRKGNDSTPKRSKKAKKDVGCLKGSVAKPRTMLVKENSVKTVKDADETTAKQYKKAKESCRESKSVSSQTDRAAADAQADDSLPEVDTLELESDSESSKASTDVKSSKKAHAKQVKVYPVVNGELVDSKKMPDPIRVEDPENWQQFALFKQVSEKCEKCDRTFSSNRELRQHFSIVHKTKSVKPNKCPDCGQEFEVLSYLKHHQLLAHKIGQDLLKPTLVKEETITDSDEDKTPVILKPKPKRILPKCSECKQAFPCAEQLGNHLIQCHSNKVVFSDLILCELCDEVFMLVKDFLVHKRDVHNLNPNMSSIGQNKLTVKTLEDNSQMQTAVEVKESQPTDTEIEQSPAVATNIEIPSGSQMNVSASEVKGDLLSLMQMTSQHVRVLESNTIKTHVDQPASSSIRNDQNAAARNPGHRTNPVEIKEDDTNLNIVSCGNASDLLSKKTANSLPKSDKQLDQIVSESSMKVLKKPLHKNMAVLKRISKTENEKYLKSLTENEKDVKLFYCDVCNKHVRNLHTHILIHTREKPFKCTNCQLAFSSSAVLKMHLKLHTRGHLPFICSFCGKKFLQELDFKHHKSHGCSQSGKDRFTSRAYTHNERVSLKELEQDFSIKRRTTVDDSGEQISHSKLIVSNDHEESDIQDVSTDHSYGSQTNVSTGRSHSDQTLSSDPQTLNSDSQVSNSDSQIVNSDPQSASADEKAVNSDNHAIAESFYRCMICGKVGADLHAHMMTHASEAVNKCNDCGKGFTSKLALKDHMSTHRSWVPRRLSHNHSDVTVKWHPCQYCDKKFLYMQSLHRHLVTHTGVYPRHCFVCSKGFVYPKDMYFHIRSHKGYEDWSPEKPTTKDQAALSNPYVSMIECGTDPSSPEYCPSVEGDYHICSKCKSKFRSLSDVTNHVLFKCHICGKAYKKSGSILEHMAVHSDGAYKCDVCESTFQTQSGLRSHKTLHIQGDFQCPHCSKSFIFKSRLNKHLLTHEESKSFECDVCQKRYRYKGDLTKHKVVHASEKRFKCTLCPRAFHTQTELKSHSERVHPVPGSGRQLYMCNVCGRESQSYSALKTHIKIHSAVKPYSCDVCQKRFHSKTNRNQHMRVHSDDKPYKCDLCPKQYKSSNALNLHHQVLHQGIRPYSCKICGKSFGEQNKLYLHMRCHTGETPYECSMCDKRFSHKSLLTNHTAIHTGQKKFVCEFCNRSFTQRTNLVVHRRRHTGERPYNCKFCTNSYRTSNALANHVRTHTGEQPFVCDVCTESFMFKKKLWKHMKVHSSRQPYQCRKCRMIFVLKDNFDKHYQNHIKDEENARRLLQAEQEKKKLKKMNFIETSSAVTLATASDDGSGSLIQCFDLPFACGNCSSRFRTIVELNNHKTTHLLQPFQCALCKETFCSPDVLSAHLIKHVDSVSISTTTPSSTTTTTNSMSNNHSESQTIYDKNSFICSICYKSFTHKNNLIEHKKTHVQVKPEVINFDISPAVSSITSDTSGEVSRHITPAGESGPVVVVEYTDSEIPTHQEVGDGSGYVGNSQESIIIERGVSDPEQQPYITIQVPPDYNENISELISQASDYLDILMKNEITI